MTALTFARSTSTWDEVWAEYDARTAPRTPPPARPAPQPAPVRVKPFRLQWPRRWGPRRSLLALGALLGVYLVSPIASAVQFAAALQRADPATISGHVDWSQLRPALETRLADLTAARLDGSAPAFLVGMQQDMATRLASPTGLASALNQHLAAAAGTYPYALLRHARPVDATRWEVSLASPDAPESLVTLTLQLTEPWQLSWRIVGVQLPAPVP